MIAEATDVATAETAATEETASRAATESPASTARTITSPASEPTAEELPHLRSRRRAKHYVNA
jgi:hypothetical protein